MGITLKHFLDTFADDNKDVPSRYQDSIQLDSKRRIIEQPMSQEGILTIQYPEEKRLLPERFRYIPMLIWDTEKNEDRCTACGICAKVCPPQCIWIVRDSDANGKPVTRPSEFYIDAAVCMSCSFCVEFCPFDAIKMNHDYELATFDRYPHLVYDMEELTVPIEYYAALWPVQYAEEEEIRRKTEEEDKAKAAAKAQADAEKAAAAKAAPAPTPVAEATSGTKSKGAAAAPVAAVSDEAAAKKARLEELKRQAAEKAKQRKESSE
jgi:NADH-quinone oxidoreductase subunit I